MAEPALRELRRIFRAAHITHVARPWVAGLFAGENLHDDTLLVTDAEGRRSSVKQFFADVRQLKARSFDAAVLLTNSFGTALTARAARIRQIAGYATDWRGAFLHTIIPFEKDYQSRHQVFYYLNIAAELEKRLTRESQIDLLDTEPQLHADAEHLQRARELLGWQALPPEATPEPADLAAIAPPPAAKRPNRFVAINPGATNSRAKHWLAERFAATADRLAEQDGFQSVIVGAAGDSETATQVQNAMRTPAINLAGKTSIAELKAVLSLCQLVLSNDTGSAHVAAALGVPTVVIFGPTEHFVTHPLSHKAAVVRHDVDCSPCMLRECPIDHRCMTHVEVNVVYLTAINLLNQEEGELLFDA